MTHAYLKTVRRNKRMIDLSDIGREEMLLEALRNKDQWLKEKYPEARIVEKLEDLFIPLPTFTAEEKIELWRKIKTIIAIRQYLPWKDMAKMLSYK